MKKRMAELSGAAVFLFSWHAAIAGTLQGIVRDNSGQVLEGVMIRITDPISGKSESVFSNASGEYLLTTDLRGELTLRLRTPYHRDFSTTVDLMHGSGLYKEFSMEVMTTKSRSPTAYLQPITLAVWTLKPERCCIQSLSVST